MLLGSRDRPETLYCRPNTKWPGKTGGIPMEPSLCHMNRESPYSVTTMKSAVNSFTTLLQSHDNLMSELLSWVPYIPISMRKVLVSCCQLQQGPLENPRLYDEFHSAYPREGITIANDKTLFKKVLLNTIGYGVDSAFKASLLWMILRSAPELGKVESDEIMTEGLWKEFHASQEEFSSHQVNNYAAIVSERHNTRLNIELPLLPHWAPTARYMANQMVKLMADLTHTTLYPKVQRKKNTSRETGHMLVESGWAGLATEARTVDLEVWYYRTGLQVQGVSEMRVAWKYNDLKPRAYYCAGGESYWPSRYMKEVTNYLMSCVPTTHRNRRMDPTSIMYSTDPEAWVTAWDYTSFTTTLSELKFFLYWIGKHIEENFEGRAPLSLFDYRDGIVRTNPGTLILSYNESANILAPFDLHRVIDRMDLLDIPVTLFEQQNSGMLGVPGNIGLSTMLHGLHLLPAVTNSGSGVCVGDDALGATWDSPHTHLFPHLSKIGIIHPEKSYTFPPPIDFDENCGKFLKRRLTRDENGLYLLELFDIPILNYVFGETPKNRTIYNQEPADRLYTILGQVSSLLWKIYLSSTIVNDHDIGILRHLLDRIYQGLKLPFHGALPGKTTSCLLKPGERVRYSVPCILFEEYDPRVTDWSEYLWNRCLGETFFVQVLSEEPVYLPDSLWIGEEYDATESRWTRVLQDIGCIREVARHEYRVRAVLDNLREYKVMLKYGQDKNLKGLYTYKVIGDVPMYYEQVHAHISRRVFTVPNVVMPADLYTDL
jgi:hypothetical protein